MCKTRRYNLILLAVLLVASTCVGVFVTANNGDAQIAVAEQVSSVQGEGYRVTSIVADGKVVGIRMTGSYFGLGVADVSVEVYDEVDFAWDNPQTDMQKQTKLRLTRLFDDISQLCVSVDDCADLLYDGSDGNGSDLWRYNNSEGGTTLQISPVTYEMLDIAKRMYSFTDGLFNPCLQRLVDLWGFSPRFTDGVYAQKRYAQPYDRVYDYTNGSYPLPDDEFVTAFAKKDFVDFAAVRTYERDGNYFIVKPDVSATVCGVQYTQWLDLGGIAKGYACDKIAELLRAEDIDGYYVDVGGSSAVCGTYCNGEAYSVAVTDPFDPVDTIAYLSATNRALSTSGTYRRFFTVDGQRFSHIIDATSGKPTDGILYGVTLLSDNFSAAEVDCITTAMIVGGVDWLTKFVNDNPDAEVFAQARTTDGNKQILSDIDSSFVRQGGTFADYANALVLRNGKYRYDSTAAKKDEQLSQGAVVAFICTTFCVLIIVSVALCATKWHKKGRQIDRTKEPVFRKGDVAVYFAVASLVVVLFVAFAASPLSDKTVTVLKAVDMTDGSTVFAYDVSRNAWIADNDGWVVDVDVDGSKLTVSLGRTGDEVRFNVFEIVRGDGLSVKMTDAVCGTHKECVNNFGAINAKGQSIVCSPNGLKLVSE